MLSHKGKGQNKHANTIMSTQLATGVVLYYSSQLHHSDLILNSILQNWHAFLLQIDTLIGQALSATKTINK
jgi:hypothetical protein